MEREDDSSKDIGRSFRFTLPPSQQEALKVLNPKNFLGVKPTERRMGVMDLVDKGGMLLRKVAAATIGEYRDNNWALTMEVLKGRDVKEENVRRVWEGIMSGLASPNTSLAVFIKTYTCVGGERVEVEMNALHLAFIYNCTPIIQRMMSELDEENWRRICSDLTLKSNVKTGGKTVSELATEYGEHCHDEIFELSLLHLATKYNCSLLQSTLAHFSTAFGKEFLANILGITDMRGFTVLHLSALNKTPEAMGIILDAGGNLEDRNKLTGKSLHHLARNVNILEFLHSKKSNLTTRDFSGNNLLSEFLRRDRDLAMEYLDGFISGNSYSSNSEKFEVVLDLSPMIALPDPRANMDVDEEMVLKMLRPQTAKMQEIMLHPVVNTYIILKYNAIIKIFLMVLVLQMLEVFSNTILFLNYKHWFGSVNLDQGTNLTCMQQHNNTLYLESGVVAKTLYTMGSIFSLLSLLSELAEIGLEGKRWLEPKNIFQLIKNILTGIFFISLIFTCGEFQNFIGACVTIIAWIDLTFSLGKLMFGRMSNLGIYILMMRQVLKKICVFFGLYLTVVIGFAFTFHLMGKEDFKSSAMSLVKVIAMMVGELEYQDSFSNSESSKDFVISAVFVIFVFIVPIIINNLIIGLTVSNVSELLTDASIYSLVAKISTIISIEKYYFRGNRLVSRVLRKLFGEHAISKSCLQYSYMVTALPGEREKTILSEEDITSLYYTDIDNTKRVVQFVGVKVYIPLSVLDQAVLIMQNKHKFQSE